ncbi:MAG: ABC transporter substrate-binding protein, partial [Mailhella sp.]|nr:ABC transporter substrate-binding protein [Mailhella sp.]
LDPAVFGPVPALPVTDGSGNIRPQMRQALALFKEAGWEMKDGVMRNAKGESLRLLFPLGTPSMQRTLIPYQNTLKRMGIALDIQTPDQTQYINRLHSDDYDMVLATVRQSDNPGNEQRSCWSSKAADQRGSRNYANVRMPVVDEIVERLIAATSYEDLTVAASVLDRVLRHEAIVIPGWYGPEAHIAWWNGRIQPSTKFPPNGIDLSAWCAAEGNK